MKPSPYLSCQFCGEPRARLLATSRTTVIPGIVARTITVLACRHCGCSAPVEAWDGLAGRSPNAPKPRPSKPRRSWQIKWRDKPGERWMIWSYKVSEDVAFRAMARLMTKYPKRRFKVVPPVA